MNKNYLLGMVFFCCASLTAMEATPPVLSDMDNDQGGHELEAQEPIKNGLVVGVLENNGETIIPIEHKPVTLDEIKQFLEQRDQARTAKKKKYCYGLHHAYKQCMPLTTSIQVAGSLLAFWGIIAFYYH